MTRRLLAARRGRRREATLFGDENLAHERERDAARCSDLAGIRDAEALAKLPAAERREWHALWADIDSLLAKVFKP